ncbi:MAG: hypothetical protein ABJN35_11635 [Erythrobacter sp.]
MTKPSDAIPPIFLLTCAFALSACNPSSGGAPGAVSEGEAAALEEAAEMLDERQLPEGALPPIDATDPSTAESGQDATEEGSAERDAE